MNAVPELLPHYRQMAQDVAVMHPFQQQAAGRLGTLPLPDRRAETWRYTPLSPLLGQAFVPVGREEGLLTVEDVAALRLTDAASPCIVLLNGFFMPDLSVLPEDSALQVCDLRRALQDGLPGTAQFGTLSGVGEHLFTALNGAMAGEGAYVHLPAGSKLATPLEIIHIAYSFDSGFITNPRLLVVVGEGAELLLVEQHTDLADTLHVHNGVTEVVLEAAASLTHPRLQNASLRSRHLAGLYVRQAAGSRYQGTTLALGAAWSRTEFHVDCAGAGAECGLNGFYLAGGQQAHGMHLDVIHAVPECSSRETFKGILYGQGKAVFDGNIVVKPDAQKTDARLSNDNLLLSREAEIDTKPRLEIYADDVQCSHGTTVGQIDPEALFYLRARGIPRSAAVAMVCQGFAGELMETCQWPPMQERAMAILQQRLASVVSSI